MLRSFIFVLLCCSLFGCVDPSGAFDDFAERVPDASNSNGDYFLDPIPDLTGEYLVSVQALGETLEFIATVEMTAGTPTTLTWAMQPISRDDRTLIGDSQDAHTELMAAASTTIAVPQDMPIVLNFPDLFVPAAGSPLGDTTADAILSGFVRSEDCMDGPGDGMVKSPLEQSLGGGATIFAAVRIAPGTTGMDLPATKFVCDAP